MPANIVIRIGASSAQAVGEIGKVNKALGDQMTTGEKASSVLKKAAVPAAIAFAAITAGAVSAARAAVKYQADQAKLAGVLKRTTGATDDQVKAAQKYTGQLSKQTAIAGSQLRPALGVLATATGDITKAQKGLQVATDVSAASGRDMSAVSAALAKAYAGQGTSLNRMIPGLDKAAISSGDFTRINEELARVTGGAAVAAAQTQAGQLRLLELQTESLKRQLGEALLPAMGQFITIGLALTDVALKNQTAIKVLVGIVGGLSGAILAANVALKAWTAAQTLGTVAVKAYAAALWLVNAALAGNPIVLVTIALVALGAAFVIAYQRSETFRNVVGAAMSAVRVAVDAVGRAFSAVLSAATAAFNWIKAHWTLALLGFGPVGVGILLLVKYFDQVRAAGRLAFAGVAAAAGAVVSAINAAIQAVRDLIAWLGKIKIPKIPKLPGTGGLYGYGAPALAYAGGGSSRAAAGGGVTINVFGALDPEGTARTINRMLNGHARRQGRRLLG